MKDEDIDDLRQENELLLLQVHQLQEELEQYYLRYKELEEKINGNYFAAPAPSSHLNTPPPKLLRLIMKKHTPVTEKPVDGIVSNSPQYRALRAELDNIRKQEEVEKEKLQAQINTLLDVQSKVEREKRALIEEKDRRIEKLKERMNELEEMRKHLLSELDQIKADRDEALNVAAEKEMKIKVLNNDVTEKQARLQHFEEQAKTHTQQRQELDFRQHLLDEELVKAEAQLELIKDVVLRDKAF